MRSIAIIEKQQRVSARHSSQRSTDREYQECATSAPGYQTESDQLKPASYQDQNLKQMGPIKDERREVKPAVKMQAIQEEVRNPPQPHNASRLEKAELKVPESRAEHTSYHYFDEPPYLSEIEYHPLTRPKNDQRSERMSYNEQGSGERRVQFSQITSDSNPSTKSAGSMEMQQGSAPHVSESFTPPSSTGLGRTRPSYRRLDDSPERNPRAPSTERLTSTANYPPRCR